MFPKCFATGGSEKHSHLNHEPLKQFAVYKLGALAILWLSAPSLLLQAVWDYTCIAVFTSTSSAQHFVCAPLIPLHTSAFNSISEASNSDSLLLKIIPFRFASFCLRIWNYFANI